MTAEEQRAHLRDEVAQVIALGLIGEETTYEEIADAVIDRLEELGWTAPRGES